MKFFIQQFVALSICFVAAPLSLLATHNRAGEITYTHIEGLTFDFTITTYTDPGSPADRDALTISWGDDQMDTLPRSGIVSLAPNVQQNSYYGTHTYSGPGLFEISMVDPNRVEDILNITGSVNVPFCLITVLNIIDPIAFGYNSSPVLLNPPIDYANVGNLFIHNPGAFDPDDDELKYSLVVPLQYPGVVVPGYEYPDDRTDDPTDSFSIDSITGDVVWDVPPMPGIFNIAILIEEFRDGLFVGSVLRDMEIFVEETSNNAPVISNLNDTCIFAGDFLSLVVTASDTSTLADAGQTLTMSAEGGPFFIDLSPATFSSTSSTSVVTGTFNWQTVCGHVREQFYEVIFKVEDDFQLGFEPIPLVDIETWLIYVIAPPPLNIQAEPTANQITVTWEAPYSCESAENFLGFSVWRKIGCDSLVFDNCQRGLAGFEYDSIAFVEDAYAYIDENVIYGQSYSYRILAEFGQHSELAPDFVYNQVSSAPSDNACAELKRDLPIINHVSVLTTSSTNGTMYVEWYKPLDTDLDTTIFLPPYKYEVVRYTGFEPIGEETLIATFTAEAFYLLTDTAIIDTFLNTIGTPYTYQIHFYFGSDTLLGSTEAASSVFLNASPGDNKLNLTWNFNVPWLNFQYDIFKETPTGSANFEFIATTSEPSYTDTGLANGSTYCYYVKAYGQYTIETLPDTLINFSQIQCGVPVDNEPPCAPVLTVENICQSDDVTQVDASDLKNDLIWSNPNNSCADDVIQYNIYYASLEGEQLDLIDSILTGDDTTYTHGNLLSIAGCYVVVAVDSFANESVFSNIVCVNNCSDYYLPNAFTPNNDGFNDLFTPVLPFYFIDHVDMKIFDRWGNLVFEATDPMLNWDGTDINSGRNVSEGIYYYVCNVYEVTVEGVQQIPAPQKGYIHLIRSKNLQ
jgi:gliding motility-associated-like protein